jgi:hypothetical protein
MHENELELGRFGESLLREGVNWNDRLIIFLENLSPTVEAWQLSHW